MLRTARARNGGPQTEPRMNATLIRLSQNGAVRFGGSVLVLLVLIALAAPWLGTVDPAAMDASHIYAQAGTRAPFAMADGSSVPHALLMGGDSLGRDIWSRVVYGTRVSLLVGLFTAIVALALGVVAGTIAGYFRRADAILMRFMDGLMAIPAILLAIALVAALGAKVWTVVVAIAIPEVPRVTRLVRSLVLTLREEPFVEAARALATPTPVILVRHILPNAMAPMIVQGTFIMASAVLTEAILSFLGLGLPPDVPTWGNIMAEGRIAFSQYPGAVLWPALFLVPTVLAVNLLGDGLRDVLDPKFAKR
jgi:peptide/nickel transport system permease protein